MIKQTDRALAAQIVERGLLTQDIADKYLAEIKQLNTSLKDHLIKRGYVPERQVLECLAAVLGVEMVDLRKLKVPQDVIDRVPVRFAWYYKFLPVRLEGKTLTVATSSPLDVKLLDDIRVHLGLEPRTALARESEIFDAINKYYGLAADTVERLKKESEQKPAVEEDATDFVEDLEAEGDDASISRLVNQILLEAYKKRATDIHIEPYRSKVRVRYRIDGVLVDANIPPAAKGFLPSIISRIKILANLSIVEKRLPQDGSAVVKTKDQDLDLRVSTIPTPRGESMVIRILPTEVMMYSLEKLGLNDRNINLFRSLIKKPHGIILATGPTGSGKTTTLYACLSEINSADCKIITLEDPIEYEMEGITQIQVNPKVDLSFAAGLRSVLRHDPDIIMVGEVRDQETAEIAIRTALTGHLVFSTLHTNDAASGITRLVEMGLEPFLVSSSIEAFVAQRLVRMICPSCRKELREVKEDLKTEIAASLQLKDRDKIKIFHGEGCDQCNGTGFYGRTAIYEILVVNDDIREAILERRRADGIKALAMSNGMITLRQEGWRMVIDGLTTPEEVLNITAKDDLPGDKEKKSQPAAQKKGSAPLEAQASLQEERVVPADVLKVKNNYESRTYPRVDARVGIRYALVRQDPTDPTRLSIEKIEHASVTKDISSGGVRFVSGYTLPVGTILDLKVQLNKNEKSIDCLAKICRVEDDALSSMFSIVAYYLDIPSGDRAKITQFVKELQDNGLK